MSIEELEYKIRSWAFERNLQSGQPEKQVIKLGEEFGELCSGMAKGNHDVIEDSIGDMFVVMVVFCLQKEIELGECIEKAYNEIKDRKGKMVDGVFIKEVDL